MSNLRFEPTLTERGPVPLAPVIAQDAITGEVRMFAWANEEAVAATLETRRATFFSRSRGKLWEKGATSGNTLDLVGARIDCDGDAVIYLVHPNGPTCHTGAQSCFFRGLRGAAGGWTVEDDNRATTVLGRLDEVLRARAAATAETSYVKSLYDAGPDKIGAKVREEAGELARAVGVETDDRVVSEAADVLFHVMVALRYRGRGIDDVLRELDRRTGTSGHDEKRARPAP